MKISRRSLLKTSAAVLGSGVVAPGAIAQTVGPDALKTTLNPFGGIRAGNADGTIPAWTGEAIPLPADYVSGTLRPVPFADEKPLFRITAANMAQYQDKLNAGDIYLLQNNADYYMDIYPTHRTAIAPQFVYDYTYKNATSAQLSADGNNLSGAYGGVPFPIPTTGKQVLWNHALRWLGVTLVNDSQAWLVTDNGETVLKNDSSLYVQFPYYFNGRQSEFGDTYSQLYVGDTAPPYLAGEGFIQLLKTDPMTDSYRTWEYLIGERRTRLAPQLLYDTPIDVSGGVVNSDEGQTYNGPLDQYNCQLIGKKEMYVVYNGNKLWNMDIKDALGPKHIDPSTLRWELHRVWEVDMTLLPGKRNVDNRRVMYADEDTGGILGQLVYDADNTLWKYHHAVPGLCSDIPALSTSYFFVAYDFHAGEYVPFGCFGGPRARRMQPIAELPDSYFTPGQLSARAGGF